MVEKGWRTGDKRGSERWKGEMKAMMQAVRSLENSERLCQLSEEVQE